MSINRRVRHGGLSVGLALGLLPAGAQALVVEAGIDYLYTLSSFGGSPGASSHEFEILGELVTVDWIPGPPRNVVTSSIGENPTPADTVAVLGPDTIVQRLQDTKSLVPTLGGVPGPENVDTIGIEFLEVSLQSKNPVIVGGQLYDLKAMLDRSLDPNGLIPDGSMTITYTSAEDFTNLAEGTWVSSFDISFVVDVLEAGTNSVVASLPLRTVWNQDVGANWSTTMTGKPSFPYETNFFTILDADGDGVPDPGGAAEHDGWIISGVPPLTHVVTSTPEINAGAAPVALLLLLGGLALHLERRRVNGKPLELRWT